MELNIKSTKRKSPILTITDITDISKKKKASVYYKKRRRLSCDESIANKRKISNQDEGKLKGFSEQKNGKRRTKLQSMSSTIDPRLKIVKDFVRQTQMHIQKLYKGYKKKYQLDNNKRDSLYNLYEACKSDDDNKSKSDSNLNQEIISRKDNKLNQSTICNISSFEINNLNKAIYYRGKIKSSYDNIIKENNLNQYSVISLGDNALSNKIQRYKTWTSNYEVNPNQDLLLKINALIEEKVCHLKEKEGALQEIIKEKNKEIAQMKMEYDYSILQLPNIQKEVICGLNTITNMNQYINELKNNIKVFCRIKPHTNNSSQRCVYYPDITDEGINNNTKSTLQTIELRNSELNTSAYYNFDKIFRENIDQNTLLNNIKHSLCKILEGESVLFILIGQTNSGKSYTLKGEERNNIQPNDNDNTFTNSSNDKLNENEGIIQRYYMHIVQDTQKQGIDIKISIGIAIIINDKIYELFHNKKEDQCLQSQLLNSTNYQLEKWNIITSKHDLNKYITYTDDVHLFKTSNRSECHMIYQLKIEHINKKYPDAFISFIKTAGSECLLYPKDNPYYYNTKSLKTTGKIISMVIDKKANKTQIPYKDTKLTQLLRHPIKNSSKIIVFVTISQDLKYYEQTNELLKYTVKSMMAY